MAVAGNDNVGGLVGRNSGEIIASYATGDADGGGGTDNVGGLVGGVAARLSRATPPEAV